MRREGAGIVLVNIGLSAKKRDLKAERLAVLGGQPTGGIPPLRAKLRVAAIICWKCQWLTGNYRCIGGRRRPRSHTAGVKAQVCGNANSHSRSHEQACRPARA